MLLSISMLLIFWGKKGKYEETEIPLAFKKTISKDPTAPMIYTNLDVLRNT